MTHTNKSDRLALNGKTIPSVTYSDQPYIAIAADGAWVCVLTTGAGQEGAAGQHIISQRSTDQGKTWTSRIAIEPSSGPEASWAVIAKAPNGRLFCFYTYNQENLRRIESINPGFSQAGPNEWADPASGKSYCGRVDSLGVYAFKYSDDNAWSWSEKRFIIPVREFDIDAENITGGKMRFFWNVGRAFFSGDTLFLPIHKVGNFGYGFFTRSEGALLTAAGLEAGADPASATWTTLPEGRIGLRAPTGAGPIAEEHSFVELSDGSLFCVYRTVSGYPVTAYSRDRGRHWSAPAFMDRGDGRLLKNPRAANFAWSCGQGRYLYWFHNNGGPKVLKHYNEDAAYPYYCPRNPVWLCGGVEVDSAEGKIIRWSEPQIALFDRDILVRYSYPDLIVDPTGFYVTETDKHLARVHRLDDGLLKELWVDAAGGTPSAPTPVVTMENALKSIELKLPTLPAFVVRDPDHPAYGTKHQRTGFSLELCFSLASLAPGQILLDSRDQWECGMVVRVSLDRRIEWSGYDGETKAVWDTDQDAVVANHPHHMTIIIDGETKVICFVLDGKLLDGGDSRLAGWGRFSPYFMGCAGHRLMRLSPALSLFRFYDLALTTSQAVGRYRTWKSALSGAT